MIVSMAADPSTGCRVGAPIAANSTSEELEYGVLREMGAVGKRTPVVTMVDDFAFIKGMSAESDALCHQVPADVICTPKREADDPGAEVLAEARGHSLCPIGEQLLLGLHRASSGGGGQLLRASGGKLAALDVPLDHRPSRFRAAPINPIPGGWVGNDVTTISGKLRLRTP